MIQLDPAVGTGAFLKATLAHLAEPPSLSEWQALLVADSVQGEVSSDAPDRVSRLLDLPALGVDDYLALLDPDECDRHQPLWDHLAAASPWARAALLGACERWAQGPQFGGDDDLMGLRAAGFRII
jgi:hypothetical protein